MAGDALTVIYVDPQISGVYLVQCTDVLIVAWTADWVFIA